MTWTLLSRRRATTGTGTSSTQECRHAEGIQTREDIPSELSQLHFGGVPWWTCSAIHQPLSVTATKKMKYGCPNISGGPCRTLTFMTWQVGSPFPHFLSCAIYQAARGGGVVLVLSYPRILGISCCFSLSHKNLPFLDVFVWRLYCFLCWYFYW